MIPWRKLLAVLAGAVLLFVTLGFLLPDRWRVERTLVVKAAPAAVRPLVADLRQWPRWFPWGEKDDPTLTRTFDGAATGTGARMTWRGERMGTGEMEIFRSDEAGLGYRMLLGDARVEVAGEFGLTPVEGGTAVRWSEGGRIANPVARWFAGSFETANGGDYQRGLLALQALVETPPPPAAGAAP